MRQFNTAHYALAISAIALLVSCGSLYISKRSYDLSAAKDERELRDKMPAIDLQIPDGATTASATISIINRSDVNITPLDILVEHSVESGELYISSPQQSINLLKTSLNLSPMGTIAPKGIGKLNARISGATDGKDNRFTPGLDLQFDVRIRFSDEQDTIKIFPVARRILPALAAEPCPPSWTPVPRPPGC